MEFKVIKSSKFYNDFYKINLPIFISQMFLVTIGIFNSIIFGQMGEKVISSIVIVDKLNSIYWPVISAIATVMTIYFLQYKGVDNKEGIKAIFVFSNFIMIGISIITFLLINIFGRKMIVLYTKEALILSDAYFYLWFIGFSNIVATCTYSLITYFNGVGRVKESSIIAMIQTFINFVLYYLFVIKINKGILFGIKGIALAITITKTIEFLFYLRIYKKSFSLKRVLFHYENLKNIKGINRKIFPLIFNNLVFMLASNVIFIGFSKMGTKETAAVGITDGLIGNFGMLLLGIVTSSKIMIGSFLGKNRMNMAYLYSKKIIKIMMVSSIVCSIFINILCRMYLKFYKISNETLDLSYNLILIASVFFTIKMLNGLIVDGILRMGGDIKAALCNDIVGILVFGVGVSIIFTRVIEVKIEVLYLLICFNELFRFCLNYRRYLSKKWLKKSIS